MAREARKISESGLYDIILSAKKSLFRDEEDYDVFIGAMSRPAWEVFAYALTDNHIFLCVHESENKISADIRTVIIHYARYFNKKYETEGKLFDGRFKSNPITSKDLDNSVNIVLNALKITDSEGVVSATGGEYVMIPFYASAMGVKAVRNYTPKQNKLPQKTLPSWLL